MKVLVMSHNPFTDYDSMGKTLWGLFSAFTSDELCQFYVFPSLPNVKNCRSIYRLTDKEAFVSIVRRLRAGRRISEDELHPHNTPYEKNEAINRYYGHHTCKELKIFVRDIIWKLSAWNNKKLVSWLVEEKPDVIFAAPGASGFFYHVIEQTAATLKIPFVTYVCDDFYFSSQKNSGLLRKLYARYIRNKIRTHMQKAAYAVTICDELARDYAQVFGCSCSTIYTGANIPVAKSAVQTVNNTVSYFGNLLNGRFESLAAMARMIDLYNAEFGANVRLNIYSGHNTPQIRAAFENARCARFCGFLPSAMMYKEMASSSLLIHAESFEPHNTERVKYSISTKIADSLSCGVCLFAYGPAGVASMEYLRRNGCAYTAFNEEELREKLFACLSDAAGRHAMAEKALAVARQNHVSTQQSKLLRSVLTEVIEQHRKQEHA